MHFTATCAGSNPLGLRERLEPFADEHWPPAHVTKDEAAEIVLDQFKRTISHTLELLELHVDQ
jgi:hypothetical protein